MNLNTIYTIDCIVTSPPYWRLRDYGEPGQLGLEETPEKYVRKMFIGFKEVMRVLKPAGTLWLNIGDSYASQGKKRTEEQACRKSNLNSGFASQIASKDQISKLSEGFRYV